MSADRPGYTAWINAKRAEGMCRCCDFPFGAGGRCCNCPTVERCEEGGVLTRWRCGCNHCTTCGEAHNDEYGDAHDESECFRLNGHNHPLPTCACRGRIVGIRHSDEGCGPIRRESAPPAAAPQPSDTLAPWQTEFAQATGLPVARWALHTTCCGMDCGWSVYVTWEAAERGRNEWVESGQADEAAGGLKGHNRVGIIRAAAPDARLGHWPKYTEPPVGGAGE